MDIKIKRLTDTATIPTYAKHGDSGFDLRVDVYNVFGDLKIMQPGAITAIDTGLSIAVPEGYELQIRPRSGLSLGGITVFNTPGTVDSGFRGEIKVILYNNRTTPFTINHGDRIAQGVICPVIRANLVEVDELDETERGNGGFGSTGS